MRQSAQGDYTFWIWSRPAGPGFGQAPLRRPSAHANDEELVAVELRVPHPHVDFTLNLVRELLRVRFVFVTLAERGMVGALRRKPGTNA